MSTVTTAGLIKVAESDSGDPAYWIGQLADSVNGIIFAPYFNAFQAAPGTVNTSSSSTVSFGSITLGIAGLVRVMVCMDVGIPATSFQGFSVTCKLGGNSMSTGGISNVQLPSSSNGPIYQVTAVGTLHVAAGSYSVQALCAAGGGGSNVSITNAYAEARQVSL